MAKHSNSGLAAALVVAAAAAVLYKYWPAPQVVQLQPGQPLHTPDFSAAAASTLGAAPDFGTGLVGMVPGSVAGGGVESPPVDLISILSIGLPFVT